MQNEHKPAHGINGTSAKVALNCPLNQKKKYKSSTKLPTESKVQVQKEHKTAIGIKDTSAKELPMDSKQRVQKQHITAH